MALTPCAPCNCIGGNIGNEKFKQDVEVILCAILAAIQGGGGTVCVTDSQTINFALTEGGCVTGDVLVSADAGNILEIRADGLYVPDSGGSYITDLTGDVSATGPGSAVATLANVNADVGSFTYSSITVNAKGLITAAANGAAPESPLTFSTGLTRTANTITGNLSTGIAGGQTAFGGTAASEDLTLQSTTNATRGTINLGSAGNILVDETNAFLKIASINSGATFDAIVVGDITGNARGTEAIDIQTSHSAATEVASGINAIAIGSDVTSSSIYSIAIGRNTIASTSTSIAIGYNAEASGDTSNIAIGRESTTTGFRATAIGYLSTSSAYYSTALGRSSSSSGYGSLALGYTANASGAAATALGASAVAAANDALTLGNLSIVSAATASAIGYLVKNYIPSSMMLGISNTSKCTIDATGLSYKVDNPQKALHINGDGLIANQGTLGSELVTNGTFTGSAASWTLASGWAYSSNTVLHNSNGTGTLTPNPSITIVAGNVYQLQFTISAWTVGTCTPACGGVTMPAVGGYDVSISNQTYTHVFVATSTANLTFTPSNTARFTIDTVSVKQITGGVLNVLSNLKIGSSTSTPTARLELPAGAAAASSAPLKFVSATNLTTAETGAVEYNGTNLFFTRSGTTREGVLTQSAVTTEVVVSDTTVTVNIGGTNYKLLARA